MSDVLFRWPSLVKCFENMTWGKGIPDCISCTLPYVLLIKIIVFNICVEFVSEPRWTIPVKQRWWLHHTSCSIQ